MESALAIIQAADRDAGPGPGPGLRAVAVLRARTERPGILQAGRARVVLAGHRHPARRHEAGPAGKHGERNARQ